MTDPINLKDKIPQTSRTILFEEFDSEKVSLKTLLDTESDLSDPEFIDKMNEELQVKSYEEFVEKYAPVIYQRTVMYDGMMKFEYSFEKGDGNSFEINLQDHPYYKMIFKMYENKGTSGASDKDFDYEEIQKVLSPESEYEEIKDIRRNLKYLNDEYAKLEANNGTSDEKKRCASKLIAYRKKTIEKYQKNPLSLLPVLIADTTQKLDSITKFSDNTGTDVIGLEQNPVLCITKISDNGDIEAEPVPEKNEKIMSDSNDSSNTLKLADTLRKDFDKKAPESIKNEYVSNMIVSVFTGENGIVAELSREVLEEKKERQEEQYIESIESFSNAVAGVVEKFIGVKAFFDHAEFEGRLPEKSSLVVTNCRADALIKNEKIKNEFINKFKICEIDSDKNRFWFGIIPGVKYEDDVELSDDINPFDDDIDFYEDTGCDKKVAKAISLDDTKKMLDIIKSEELNIITFFNFKACHKTSFSGFTSQILEDYKDKTKSLNGNKYAVIVYPNFTVLPDKKGEISVCGQKRCKVPGVYIEASYIAAGMMVASQNQKFLKSRGLTVKPENLCVRFDYEEDDNSKKILTKMNRSTLTETSSKIMSLINEDCYGFAFGDNKIIYDNKIINNSYIINTRTFDIKKNTYKSIYKTMLNDAVKRLVKMSNPGRITKTAIKKFINQYVKPWEHESEKSASNLMLRKGESISLNEDGNKIVFKFNAEEDEVDIEFVDDTNE